ncbi:hypothetical protein [Brachyspira hampsonii]|uniref:hypothetical protein n=1 Tax=Brachyspira hampsonii TaxID=1287055 RepID=UPI0002AE2228|nr:hypothetical protein [Brachyspira hampsonii]ELV06167.1 hypothetical protein H263_05847 [Brachyspira hampsonii 30599]
MLVKDLKEELKKFEDNTQILVRVKDKDGKIVLVDFGRISKTESGAGVIVPLFKSIKD